MIRCNNVFSLAVLIGLATVLIGPSPARAELVLILSDSSGHTAVATDSSSNPGQATFSGTLGNFTINLTSAYGNPNLGSPTVAEIDLNDVSITSASGGGKLTITAYETGYVLPAGYTLGAFSSSIGGTISSGGVITAQTWFDSSDKGNLATPPSFTLPTTGTVSNSLSLGSGPGNSFSGGNPSGSQVSLTGDPFALINQVTVTLGAKQSVSFDMDTTVAVPAPSGVILALSGLPVLGLCWWRKRSRQP